MFNSESEKKMYNRSLLAEYKKSKAANKKRLEKLKGKEKLNILFLIIHKQMWKMDALYRAMAADPFFNPIILVIPDFTYHKNNLHEHLNDNLRFFQDKGYRVESSFDKAKNEWRKVAEFEPDILFFSYPHQMTHDNYYEKAFRNYLSCYIPYYHQTGNFLENVPQYNRLFHNMMWKIFVPSDISLETHKEYSANKGDNVVVTGYVACEPLLEPPKKDPWKVINDGKKRKRIIWASHHTFDDTHIQLSTFHLYYDFFKELAIKYKDEVQFAFKPHPLLKPKLDAHKDWGKEKADAYYKFWESQENTQLEDGDYEDLFLTSDAMIHDCVSFIAEYHYTKKPVMYLWRNEEITKEFNKLGLAALACCKAAKEEKDIDHFTHNIIKEKSEILADFFKIHIEPYYKESPSKKIISELKER